MRELERLEESAAEMIKAYELTSRRKDSKNKHNHGEEKTEYSQHD